MEFFVSMQFEVFIWSIILFIIILFEVFILDAIFIVHNGFIFKK